MSTHRGKLRLVAAYLKQEIIQIIQVLRSILTRKKIIIVHQMGKVGSTSIMDAINFSGEFMALQTHRLTDPVRNERNSLSKNAGSGMKYASILSRFINCKHAQGQWKERILVTVRDPVSRYLSDFFHNIENYHPENGSGEGSMMESFCQNYDFGYFDFWMRNEIEFYYGVKIEDFVMYDWGGEIDVDGGKIIIIKSELSDHVKSKIIKEKLSVNVEVKRENVLERGEKAEVYGDFKKKVSLGDDLLDAIYSQAWVTKIYSSEEIERFKRKWRR